MGVRAYAPREDGNVMLETAAVGRDPRESPRVCTPVHLSSAGEAPGRMSYCVLLNIYKLVSAYRTFRSLASRSPYASLYPLPLFRFRPLCNLAAFKLFDHFASAPRTAPL